jgi:hypothetical protein
MSLKDQPSFRTVRAPASYPRTTSAAVRYVPVLKGDTVLGYLWAAVTDDAAQYVPRAQAGDDGLDAGIAWTRRLREAVADGLAPLEALARWAGEAEDERAGRVPPGTPFTLPDLSALEDLAASG